MGILTAVMLAAKSFAPPATTASIVFVSFASVRRRWAAISPNPCWVDRIIALPAIEEVANPHLLLTVTQGEWWRRNGRLPSRMH